MTYRRLPTHSKEQSATYVLVPPKIQCFAAQTFKQGSAADPWLPEGLLPASQVPPEGPVAFRCYTEPLTKPTETFLVN